MNKNSKHIINYTKELEAVIEHLCDDLCSILHVLDPDTLRTFNVSEDQIKKLQSAVLNKDKLHELAAAFGQLATKASEYTNTLSSFGEAHEKTNKLLQLLNSLEAGSQEIQTKLLPQKDINHKPHL